MCLIYIFTATGRDLFREYQTITHGKLKSRHLVCFHGIVRLQPSKAERSLGCFVLIILITLLLQQEMWMNREASLISVCVHHTGSVTEASSEVCYVCKLALSRTLNATGAH